ncbi:alpha-2-macroglobulin-like protein 1, partial [Terrapene carolina triunguis]|uniref:alpha-2-macroglobulin-like protein 1 n=1 Tax=Terrapene triunguis TaxID=2587831 RepID=UPI0011561BD8
MGDKHQGICDGHEWPGPVLRLIPPTAAPAAQRPLVLCWGTGVRADSKTKRNGCFSRKVGTDPLKLSHSGYRMSLQAKASLVEEGTGVELNVTKSCNVVSEIPMVTFEDSDATYKTGMPYTGKMLLETEDGSVLKNEKLQLFVSYGDKNKNQTFLTDESGRASFELDTSGWTGWVNLR